MITTNDIHGVVQKQKAYFMNPNYPPTIIGGAGFYKYINNYKAESNQDNFIVLDAGNFFQGSNFGMFDQGASMVEWMNLIDYDAFVPGQYDFIFGIQNLNTILNNANFEVLGSNLQCNNCINKIKPYIIKEIEGIKIGILGIINSNLPELVPNSKLEDATFALEFESIQKWVPEMKQNEAE